MAANANQSQIKEETVIQMLLERMDKTDSLVESIVESTNELNTKFAIYVERNTHTEKKIDELEDDTKHLRDDVDDLQKSNIRIFSVAGVYASVAVSLLMAASWWYVNVYKEQQKSSLTNQSAIEAIDSLNKTNKQILKLLEPTEGD